MKLSEQQELRIIAKLIKTKWSFQMNPNDPKLEETWNALNEIGLDPFKMLTIKLFSTMAEQFIIGEWTREQFQENCGKLNILNDRNLSIDNMN